MSVKDKIKVELVVVENFLKYVKGEIITEAKEIEDLIESEWQNHFVKKAAADKPVELTK